MAARRRTPADLADEVQAAPGPWLLSNARLRPPSASDSIVAITFAGAAVWSEIALDRRPLQWRKDATAALRRSGYEILAIRSKPFHARRRLRGVAELDAEVQRLNALSRDRSALAMFPRRQPRRRGLPAEEGPFAAEVFDRLRTVHRWALEHVSAFRKGAGMFVQDPAWSAGAWCLFLDDGCERWIDLHVQLFPARRSNPRGDEGFASLESVFRERLGSLGYRQVDVRTKMGPRFAVFEKRVQTLSAARRERQRLDRVLFGEQGSFGGRRSNG